MNVTTTNPLWKVEEEEGPEDPGVPEDVNDATPCCSLYMIVSYISLIFCAPW